MKTEYSLSTVLMTPVQGNTSTKHVKQPLKWKPIKSNAMFYVEYEKFLL